MGLKLICVSNRVPARQLHKATITIFIQPGFPFKWNNTYIKWIYIHKTTSYSLTLKIIFI